MRSIRQVLVATLAIGLLATPVIAEDTAIMPDLLPGVDLVTEEVEPGVYRVLGDAAGHDLVAEPPAGVTVAADGSIWLLRASEDRGTARSMDPYHDVDAVLRLGQEGTHRFESSSSDFVDLAVDIEGAAWVSVGSTTQDGRWGYSSAQGNLTSLNGGRWANPAWPDGSTDVGAIEGTADGTVWVAQNVEDGPGPKVARIKDGEWQFFPPEMWETE